MTRLLVIFVPMLPLAATGALLGPAKPAACAELRPVSSSLVAPGDELIAGLKRAAFLGTKLGAVPDEARQAAKLSEDDGGAIIEEVFPESSALAAGLQQGDILLRIDGEKVGSAAFAVAKVAGRKAGGSFKVELARGEKRVEQVVTLKGRPLEKNDDFDIIYGSVESRGHRLRTIATKPKTGGKHPALFFIQGVGLYSIDNPIGATAMFRTILDDFARRGWVTLRVEKPGVGDSEGGPGLRVDFDAELDGYRQGLKMLKGLDFVDSENVVLFGHSMGGVMAPLIAADLTVKGIAVYGTISKTWHEYVLENFRRQMTLSEAEPVDVDRRVRTEAAFAYHLCNEKMSPREIATKFPDLKRFVDQVAPDGVTYFGRHYAFFQQLAAKDLGECWARYAGYALAMWGKSDFVSGEGDHELIAALVNRDHPGHGTFAPIAGADHGFARAESYRDALRRSTPEEFNPAVLETLRAWAERVVRGKDKP
jgi:pimeloyl-ACP methyl ester carboxylesterase